MPRGKELEQLPMAHIAPSAGHDPMATNREVLSGGIRKESPSPSKVMENKR